ncbi:hypothetical protein [Spiroplasma mirum]|nr:hypothetical protein [Spiroplasma atrichopogonis]AKM52723.1 hypothetical protein SATRI_v1c01540 [Spiroplasma atrichopogonis]
MSKFPHIVDFDKREGTITNDEFKSKIKNKLIILLQSILEKLKEKYPSQVINFSYDLSIQDNVYDLFRSVNRYRILVY